MYSGYIIHQREEGSAEKLRALALRELCSGLQAQSAEQATEEHLYTILFFNGLKTMYRERQRLEIGIKLWSEGYRFRRSERVPFGTQHHIPEEALAWALVSDGDDAHTSYECLVYLVKEE